VKEIEVFNNTWDAHFFWDWGGFRAIHNSSLYCDIFYALVGPHERIARDHDLPPLRFVPRLQRVTSVSFVCSFVAFLFFLSTVVSVGHPCSNVMSRDGLSKLEVDFARLLGCSESAVERFVAKKDALAGSEGTIRSIQKYISTLDALHEQLTTQQVVSSRRCVFIKQPNFDGHIITT
jgi:predicted transcriptional regulator